MQQKGNPGKLPFCFLPALQKTSRGAQVDDEI
jgi:hypothetical protein